MVLNSILDILNERRFQQGAEEVRSNLISAFLMSNEKPQSEELAAFWDRCLARCIVQDIQEDSNFLEFIRRKTSLAGNASSGTTLDIQELLTAITEVSTVEFSEEACLQVKDLRNALKHIGIYPSPRRWSFMLRYLQAEAWMDGRDAVDPDDFVILADCLWEKEDDYGQISQVLGRTASPDLGRVLEVIDENRKLFSGVSVGNPEASAILECNTKLNAAAKMLEKIEKSTTSAKAKKKALESFALVKSWQKTMLERLGVGM